MGKHLCIDCGNSRIKAAVFASGEIVSHEVTDYDHLAPVCNLARSSDVSAALLTSTTERTGIVVEALKPLLSCELNELSHSTPLPLSLAYHTPETLGRDRIAAAVGAWQMFTGCNLLVVDAGTCVTMDVVTADGTFVGGNIAPGVEMRLRAMHRFTSRLPLVEADGDVPLLGYDTATALRSGAVQGVACEVDGLVLKLQALLRQLKVFVTGGSARLLAGVMAQSGYTVEPDLVLHGLDAIMTFNEE